MSTTAYRVTFSYATNIPGYEPSWTVYEGSDSVEAYARAKSQAECIGLHTRGNCRLTPGLVEMYTALNDMAEYNRTESFALDVMHTTTHKRIGSVIVARA